MIDTLVLLRYIIAGNSFHNLFLSRSLARVSDARMMDSFAGPYKEAYPGAKLVGPEGLLKKKELDGLQLEGGT